METQQRVYRILGRYDSHLFIQDAELDCYIFDYPIMANSNADIVHESISLIVRAGNRVDGVLTNYLNTGQDGENFVEGTFQIGNSHVEILSGNEHGGFLKIFQPSRSTRLKSFNKLTEILK